MDSPQGVNLIKVFSRIFPLEITPGLEREHHACGEVKGTTYLRLKWTGAGLISRQKGCGQGC